MAERARKRKPRKPKKPKAYTPRRADADTLTRAAADYLQRYPSSKENLRRVLARRLERAVRAFDADRREGAAVIEKVIERCENAGLIDDARYAERAAAAWHGRGEARRAIRARLAQKGVASALIDDALANLEDAAGDPDLAAAVALVRRRRLGPLRPAAKREDAFKKDLGVLARAGFSYALARRVLEADDDAALEDLLAEASARAGDHT